MFSLKKVCQKLKLRQMVQKRYFINQLDKEVLAGHGIQSQEHLDQNIYQNAYRDKNIVFERSQLFCIYDSVAESLNNRPRKLSPLIQLGLLNLSFYYYNLEPFIQSYYYLSSGSLAFFSFVQFVNMAQSKKQIAKISIKNDMQNLLIMTNYGKVITCPIEKFEMS